MTHTIVAYLHYLGFMVLFAALTAEHLLIKGALDVQRLRRVAVVDLVYGVAAAAVLVTGLTKLFVLGDPTYYGQNYFFHIKMTLFAVAAVLSLGPTICVLRLRRAHRDSDGDVEVTLPRFVTHVIRAELLAIVLMPLFAAGMARGYGWM